MKVVRNHRDSGSVFPCSRIAVTGKYKGYMEGQKEGRKEGWKEGQKQILTTQVRKKIEKGKSIEQIADELEEEVSVIQQICEKLMKE